MRPSARVRQLAESILPPEYLSRVTNQVQKLLARAGGAVGALPLRTRAEKPEDRFVSTIPTPQNAVDIFAGEWTSLIPATGVQAGTMPLFDDPRVKWAVTTIGGVKGKEVLELGPLEGGHAYMLEQAGARRVLSIEANVRAFLRCLIAKEITRLKSVEFLCGDFTGFLRENTSRFDVVLASGVLYHMTEPLQLLEMVSRICDDLILFTHYYDDAIPRNHTNGDPRFEGAFQAEAGGFSCRAYRQYYAVHALDALGFCGGMRPSSVWLKQQDIVKALEHFGYDSVEIGEDQKDHVNGPFFTLVARRTRKASRRPRSRVRGTPNA